jgi:hypothetical protein
MRSKVRSPCPSFIAMYHGATVFTGRPAAFTVLPTLARACALIIDCTAIDMPMISPANIVRRILFPRRSLGVCDAANKPRRASLRTPFLRDSPLSPPGSRPSSYAFAAILQLFERILLKAPSID